MSIVEPFTAPALLASNEEVKEAALEWINSLRTEYNLEPLTELPKGRKGHARDCPVAIGCVGVSDGSHTWTGAGRIAWDPETGQDLGKGLHIARQGEIVTLPVPALVNEFANRFDRGAYPELESS